MLIASFLSALWQTVPCKFVDKRKKVVVRGSVPTRIVLMNQMVHLNTVNRIIHAWTIMLFKSRYLPNFLTRGTTKNQKDQFGSIHIVLIQNFHQSSKDNTPRSIFSSQGFFINFHQKLVFYFGFKHLLKSFETKWKGAE